MINQEINTYLHQHIQKLSMEIGVRNIWSLNQLYKASNYIKQQFIDIGYTPITQQVAYKKVVAENVIAKHSSKEKFSKSIIIGAHYDTVKNCPGASDNATGVAVLIELSRLLKQQLLNDTFHFAAFANEEYPFIRTKHMGSYHYASTCRQNNENIKAMFSLDSIGNFFQQQHTQRFSFLFPTWHFPTRGNFIAFIGNNYSNFILEHISNFFKNKSGIPVKILSGPSWMRGINSSDQWSFWKNNYPAIMITDTAPFRYHHYHKPNDTLDKINFPKLSELTIDLFNYFTSLNDL